MESLALMVAIIVSPAMYGGPLALILTFWRPTVISKSRRIVITVLSIMASASGALLLIQGVSRGGTIIGLIGLIASCAAMWRLRNLTRTT
ncbi:MAG: hypothetical protein ACKOEB_07155 [Actinomycetota bacterium]